MNGPLCNLILIQNEEFMAELRSDTDFMAALQLEHDEAAVRCGIHSTSEIHICSLTTQDTFSISDIL